MLPSVADCGESRPVPVAGWVLTDPQKTPFERSKVLGFLQVLTSSRAVTAHYFTGLRFGIGHGFPRKAGKSRERAPRYMSTSVRRSGIQEFAVPKFREGPWRRKTRVRTSEYSVHQADCLPFSSIFLFVTVGGMFTTIMNPSRSMNFSAASRRPSGSRSNHRSHS